MTTSKALTSKTLTFTTEEVQTTRHALLHKQDKLRVNTIRVVTGELVLYTTVLPGRSIRIGREACELQLPDGMISRIHARFDCDDSGTLTVMDLGSANGTTLNSKSLEPHHPYPVSEGDEIAFARTKTRFDRLSADELSHLRRVARQIEDARRDPLTGLLTRRFMEGDLSMLLLEHDHVGAPVSMIFVDIDHFKSVNDTFGHDVGDEVLAGVAAVLLGGVRAADPVVRYGGEEIMVFLPNCTELHAYALAERLRKAIAWHDWAKIGCHHPITVSLGVAERATREDANYWVRRADQAMYRAKRSGRNRTVTWSSMATIQPD